MRDIFLYTIGFTAQILFSARILVQWIASEKAKAVLSPVIFWQLSIAASFMLCIYGWLRDDFAIIAGQLICYYIYIWNLRMKGAWKNTNSIIKWVFYLLPPISLVWFLQDPGEAMGRLFSGETVAHSLMYFGIAGQTVFMLRFVYQWLYSQRAGESLLPVNFWILSLTGSLMIVIYGVIRKDPVLIIGHGTGIIAYSRNIMIGMRQKHMMTEAATHIDGDFH